MADDAGPMRGLAVDATRTHGGNAVDELGFAHRPQFDRACSARQHKHGGDYVVAAAGIREQFIEQIALASPVPEMVVGIYDRQIRLKDWFLALIEPFLADGKIVGDEVGPMSPRTLWVPLNGSIPNTPNLR
jgi:hypothetical protein